MVIRDWKGIVIATLCSLKSLFPNPLLGEAAATLSATNCYAELGIRNIILQGDSLTVVNSIQQAKEDWNSAGILVRDIKHLLSGFQRWSVRHVSRNVNMVANCLAKYALGLKAECLLVGDYLPCIHHLL